MQLPQQHKGNMMTARDVRIRYDHDSDDETPGPGAYEVSAVFLGRARQEGGPALHCHMTVSRDHVTVIT